MRALSDSYRDTHKPQGRVHTSTVLLLRTGGGVRRDSSRVAYAFSDGYANATFLATDVKRRRFRGSGGARTRTTPIPTLIEADRSASLWPRGFGDDHRALRPKARYSYAYGHWCASV